MTADAQQAPENRYLQPQAVVADKYRLESRIAEGGMGSVWLATNLILERRVALKVLHSNMRNDLAEARLLREARAAAQIGHTNIVQVFDYGHIQTGEPFIVMELLRGEDLATRLTRVGRLSAVEAVKLMLPVASALAAGHAKSIIHRDMKPGNVFISIDDFGNEIPKVVDFGIAKVQSPDYVPKLTMEGRVVGSPEYLSPEQARGEDDLDAATDVWAFCVTLYEAITGDLPFHDENYNRLMRRIIEEQPRPTTDYAAGDTALWAVIARGLAKHRRARWASMEELGRALESWLHSHNVEDIPRVRYASMHSVDDPWAETSSPGSLPRSSRTQDFILPTPVPGPPPGQAPPQRVVPLPVLRPQPAVVDPNPSRVEAPPVYGDAHSSPRRGLGALQTIALVLGGLVVGSGVVVMMVALAQAIRGTSPTTEPVTATSVETRPSATVTEARETSTTDSTETVAVPEAPVATSSAPPASSPPAVVPRPPKPTRTRNDAPPIPTEPNF